MSENKLYKTFNNSGKILECSECGDPIEQGEAYWRADPDFYDPVDMYCKVCRTKQKVKDAL